MSTTSLIILIAVAILLIVGLILIWRFNKEKTFVEILKIVKAKLKVFWQNTVKYPLYILTHPIKGYTEFKTEKKGKMSVAIFLLAMFVLEQIIAFKYTGPAFNVNDQTKFNSIQMLIYGVVPVVLLAVANWTVTTLMDGKGKMKEIFMMICYSFHPMIVLGFVNIILSNFLTVDETQFITLINIVAIVLMAYMVFMGLVVVHEYGILKTVGSVILTALAACVIMFVALLIFDLSQQIYGFVYSLYKEIATRFL